MVNSPYIRSPRQKRAIKALLDGESIEVKAFGEAIGALNPRQVVMELRHQGFHGVILTRRFEKYDQDGKMCRPGKYFIPSHFKPIAEEALSKYTTLTSGNAKVVAQVSVQQPYHNAGG